MFIVKILEKAHIRKENKTHYVKRERDIMSSLDHPFFVKLYFTFQDGEKLCILFMAVLRQILYHDELPLSPSLTLAQQILALVMQRMANCFDTFAKQAPSMRLAQGFTLQK